MATRGSFQKRQKEAARREKRQLKLDRRQGRQAPGTVPSQTTEDKDSEIVFDPDEAPAAPRGNTLPNGLNPSDSDSLKS